jgi:DNA-binding GntR family transcriptional regulator
MCLHDSILAAIEVGDWAPGEKLPPETAFARAMPVSLGTVQKALQVLADDGIVERRHLDGTYVTFFPILDEISILRFVDGDGETLLPIYSKVLDIARTREAGPWSRLMPAAESFVRITRIIGVNRDFNIHNRIHLPAERFGGLLALSAHELDGVGIFHILSTRYNAPLLRTVQLLQVLAMPAPICAAIGVPAGATGAKWDVEAYSYRGLPIAHHRTYLPPNDCQLEIREQ